MITKELPYEHMSSWGQLNSTMTNILDFAICTDAYECRITDAMCLHDDIRMAVFTIMMCNLMMQRYCFM